MSPPPRPFCCSLQNAGLKATAPQPVRRWLEQAGQRHGQSQVETLTIEFVEPGSVTTALVPLRMARKLDRYRDTVRVVLEPWLVEAALARLKGALSPTDQRTIVQATRTPQKVRWPKWWCEYP